jgi:peptidoglycan/xylan/chitin deacetylase (PgdA/CDA1 family)
MKKNILGLIAPLLYEKRKLFQFFKKTGPSRVRVLIYHDVPKASMENFSLQLSFLNKLYDFLTPSDLFRVLSGDYCPDGISLVVTFDDGFISNRTIAEKVLKPLGIKALFFISPGFIECRGATAQEKFVKARFFQRHLSPEELNGKTPMDWKALSWLVSNGHAIGSHTISHIELANITDRVEMEEEIIRSGIYLSERLGVPVESFSPAFGQLNREAMEIIKRGYRFCFSSVRGFNTLNTSPYGIFRDAVSPFDPPSYLQFIVEGGLDLRYREKAAELKRISGI